MNADVLIIGGGMAAAWAAIAAARAGARVILVDKAYCGTSGVTANGGPGHWWVPPDPHLRREAVARQTEKARGLGDPAWMERILDLTWRHLPEIAPWYPFATDATGATYYAGVRGPEYMRALRACARALGVDIRDHHPAIELTQNSDGRVTGARGHALRRDEAWRINAGATIIATGGCAFRSGLIGSHHNTGDGHLMAAEAGAEFSGMEFSIAYSLSPTWASTRTLPYTAARFFDEDGHELDIPSPRAGHAHLQALGAAMLQGPVYADLTEAPAALRPILQRIQPLTPAPFARRGIDLFSQRFPVRLFGEGTIRSSGGLRIADDACHTTVPGLFAAGDAATRELVTGAASGGGAVNAAWALSSGLIAGEAAAREALAGPRARQSGASANAGTGVGRVGIHPDSYDQSADLSAMVAAIGAEIHGYDRALWRHDQGLAASEAVVSTVWRELAHHARGTGAGLLAVREAVAMAATARWCLVAARARTESRGLHVRIDRPGEAADQQTRLITAGLDTPHTRAETAVKVAA